MIVEVDCGDSDGPRRYRIRGKHDHAANVTLLGIDEWIECEIGAKWINRGTAEWNEAIGKIVDYVGVTSSAEHNLPDEARDAIAAELCNVRRAVDRSRTEAHR